MWSEGICYMLPQIMSLALLTEGVWETSNSGRDLIWISQRWNKGKCLEVSTMWLSVKCASSTDCLALKINSLLIETFCKWFPKGMSQVSSFPPVFQYFLPPPLKRNINFKISLKFRYSLCFHATDVHSFLCLIWLHHLLNRGALWVEKESSSTGIQLKFFSL